MRPPITKEEVELLMQDMEMLAERQLVGLEALEALRLLEMRRQTGKLEAIKRLISHGKEQGSKNPARWPGARYLSTN
ncbi:hypothetical protein [Klebsiella variicola]|uniref:hypothetical protein n=1 Tax=Klebsiella variicola TaxID=244366 RepID=UPI001E2ABBAB|nr:hypothetical protein [Klebsiella variicola]MCE0392399.1 hypothetical protein [Klebsiella variicola subsp. variicola]